MSVLVLIDRDVENGKYFEGYLANSFAPNSEALDASNLAYKCFIPFEGRTARSGEITRYFFYNNIKDYDISRIYITSEACAKFVCDSDLGITFGINGYIFEKTYDNNPIEVDCVESFVLA